jgi:hypothetical protein
MARNKPGKYAHLIHKLPKIVSTEPTEYQDKIELLKAQLQHSLTEISPVEYARVYRETLNAKAELEAEVYAANMQLEALSQLLIESQERQEDGWGLYGSPETTLRLANGDSVRVQPEPYTTTENRDLTRDWFIQEGLTRLLSVPWQTLNTYNKERLLHGAPEVPGTKIYVKTKLVYTPLKQESIDEALANVKVAARYTTERDDL